MPAIHFDITGDNDNIIRSLQETLDKLEQFDQISKRFSEAGVDFTSTEQAIKGVEKYIEGLEGAMEGCSDKIEELNAKIAEASSEGDNAAVAEYKQQLEETITTQSQLSEEVDSSKDALQLLKESFDDAGKSAKENEGIMVKLLGGQKNYNEIISNLPGPLKNVVSGLNGMVKAAKAFIATPLGMVLTPLILAFSALYKWLNSTAEGQQRLAKITGYLKGALAGLQQVVFDVGKALFDAFNNPKQAVNSLWQSIKNNFLNRIQASTGVIVNFGKMIGEALKGNFKEAKEAAKDMGNDFQKMFTGRDIDDYKEIANSVKERVTGIHKIGQAQSELSARENKLHRDRTAWMNEEAELDKQIAEQRNKMRMGSKTDREAAAAKMQELINQKTARNVELAREEYEIKKASNALTDSSQEDLDEEERLRARITQLETQGVTQKGFALRIQDSMNRQLGISSEKLSELIEKENELLDSLTDKQGQQKLETASLGISAMRDGFDKEMAELDNEHDQRIAALDKDHEERLKKIEDFQKAEYKARNNGSLRGFRFDENTEAVAVAMEIHETDIANEEERRRQELARTYKKYIDEYKGFVDQWNDITDKFNNDRKALTLSGAILDNPRLWDEVENEERKALESLAESWATSGQDKVLERWFDSLGAQTYDDLLNTLTILEVEMQNLGDSLPEEEANRLAAQIVLVKKALSKKDYGDDFVQDITDDIKREAIPNWTELNKVLTDTASLFKQAGNAIGGMFGDALKMAGNFVTSLGKIGNAMDAFKRAKGLKDTVGMITSGITMAGAAVSIASEVAGKIKEAKERTEEVDRATQAYYRTLESIERSKVLEGFSNAFGTDSYGQFTQNVQFAQEAGDAIKTISQGISHDTVKIKNWGKVFAQSALGPLGTLFGIGSAASKGKTIADDFVSDMRTGWQKFWGSDKNVITASISDFFDSNGNLLGDKLKEWYSTYGEGLSDANKKVVEDMLSEFDKLSDAKKSISGFLSDMFGDVASDIASGMVDQFVETGEAIQDMSKYMDDFGRSIAKSVIQSKLMGEIFTEDNQQAIADLIAAGKTSEAVSTFNGLLEKAKALAPGLNEFLAGLGLEGLGGSLNVEASSRGFAAMSQETGNELNGRFTALQISNETIAQGMTTVVTTLLSMQAMMTGDGSALSDIRDIHMIEATYLADIVKQTKPLPAMAEAIDKIQRSTANL